MQLTRRELIAGVGASAAAFGWPGTAVAQSLVVPTYGGLWAKFWQEQLLPGFTAATGIQTQLDVGLGKDFVAKVRAGRDSSPYSIFMANENVAAILRAEGFFEPFDRAKLPNAADMFRACDCAGSQTRKNAAKPCSPCSMRCVVLPPHRNCWSQRHRNGLIALLRHLSQGQLISSV